ncbi:MAG TPA: hypothetical protein VM532_10355 [Burkholderiales bacterium]|jgi:hypothetical protein|nr:hypothetical protein [Burkholderiales bacterium]
MKREVAEKISVLMLQLNSKLNDSISFVRDNCSKEEFEAYRKVAGMLMGSILLDIEEPIYQEHPTLRPHDLDGPYKVDPRIFEPRFYEWKP